jgi:hypothetical protein
MTARVCALRRVVLATAVGLAGAGCGGEVPHGGVPEVPVAASAAAAPSAHGGWGAAELVPGDLDVVLRIDLARVRATIGAEPMKELADRALGSEAGDALLRTALEQADVVWIGLRAADVLVGDRVLVVEAPRATVEFDSTTWRSSEPPGEGIVQYDALDFVPRDGTARVVDIRGRMLAFVSPVEVDAVDRLLRHGPDPTRAEPAARGLVSLDWRVRAPGVQLQNRYPSFAALLAGVDRMTAIVEPRGRELGLSARLLCHNERAASRAARFLQTIQGGAEQTERFAGMLQGIRIEASGSLVRVEWLVPADLLLGLIRSSTGASGPVEPAGSAAPAPSLGNSPEPTSPTP